MNCILFNESEWGKPLPTQDKRSQHICRVLKASEGQALTLGLLSRGVGVGRFIRADQYVHISFPEKLEPDPAPNEREIFFAHVRPLVMQRLFKDLASVGMRHLHVFCGELTDKSYFSSSLWHSGGATSFLLEGLSQGKLTLLPEISRYHSEQELHKELGLRDRVCVLDPRGRPITQSELHTGRTFVVGPERGFTSREIERFAGSGADICSLGNRIMRTELVVEGLAFVTSLGAS